MHCDIYTIKEIRLFILKLFTWPKGGIGNGITLAQS